MWDMEKNGIDAGRSSLQTKPRKEKAKDGDEWTAKHLIFGDLPFGTLC